MKRGELWENVIGQKGMWAKSTKLGNSAWPVRSNSPGFPWSWAIRGLHSSQHREGTFPWRVYVWPAPEGPSCICVSQIPSAKTFNVPNVHIVLGSVLLRWGHTGLEQAQVQLQVSLLEDRHRHREGAWRQRQGIRAMRSQSQGKPSLVTILCRHHQKLRDRLGVNAASEPPKGATPVDTLIVDF